MTQLTWDGLGERFYETGVSKGVFYGIDSLGVAWNGLTSVEEKGVDTADPLYFDGFKYADLITLGDFEGTLKAVTYPDEFLAYEGLRQSQTGFFLTHQPKTRFGLCYRTEIGNDLTGEAGYKLHILYNLLAIPASKTYETMSLDTDPIELEWDISAIPQEIDNFRPTAYVVIDSRKIDPFLLADIEEILYGNETDQAKLPDLNGFISFVMKWSRLIITDHGDGSWSADSPIPGVIVMLDETTFEITSDTATFIDGESYTIYSSDNLTEDIWPP